MKIYATAVLLFIMFQINGQDKTQVRKTFGVSISVLPQDEDHDHYMQKIGFIHRRCFGGFVLQAEFNLMHQQEPLSVVSHVKNGSYTSSSDLVQVTNSFNSSQRFFNTQWTLSKGWTNDKINLYAGAGLSISQSEMNYSHRKNQITPQLDTLGNTYLAYDGLLESSEVAKYMHVGLVIKASAEFKIVDKVSLLVQFSPELSRGWRYETQSPNQSEVNYTVVTSSMIEVGIHYKL